MVAREKDSTTIISILEGNANGKHIELVFANIHGSNTWKWKARQVEDKKFIMRFPNARMVRDWSQFKYLEMSNVDAQMKVQQWSPSVGAKGMLQQAWFRVKDIPPDQRSMRTIAKVGGLVGKVTKIDETTRFR